MAETVPDDVILGILAKLPVKSLLRFKSVCKTWYSIISDPQFSTKSRCMRPSVLICENSRKFSTITIESLLTSDENKSPTPLSLPWETEDINPSPSDSPPRLVAKYGNYFIGSCNGLVCVDHISKSGVKDDLILWNPSTRQFRRLPKCSQVRREYQYEHCVWFGYDESIHDYKLVWLDYDRYSRRERKLKLNVFTLKSNTWRSIDDRRLSWLTKEQVFGIPRNIGVLSNGAIHWWTYMKPADADYYTPYRRVILAFDLATENFQVLDVANYPFDPRVGGSCLLGNCPCCYYDADVGGMSLEIVKEYGWQGIVKWRSPMYYPILFSLGNEILAMFDGFCPDHNHRACRDRIIKFRIEEGGEKVSFPEILLDIPNEYPLFGNNIVPHLEESLMSLI